MQNIQRNTEESVFLPTSDPQSPETATTVIFQTVVITFLFSCHLRQQAPGPFFKFLVSHHFLLACSLWAVLASIYSLKQAWHVLDKGLGAQGFSQHPLPPDTCTACSSRLCLFGKITHWRPLIIGPSIS